MLHHLQLLLSDGPPVKLQLPVEGAHEVCGHKLVLESFLINGLYHWARHCPRIAGDPKLWDEEILG